MKPAATAFGAAAREYETARQAKEKIMDTLIRELLGGLFLVWDIFGNVIGGGGGGVIR